MLHGVEVSQYTAGDECDATVDDHILRYCRVRQNKESLS